MSTTLTLVLLGVAIAALVVRRVSPRLPVSTGSAELTTVDVTLLALGIAGLVFHCTAMFHRAVFTPFVVFDSGVAAVNAMGAASVVLYVVPALLVLLALRRLRPWMLVGVALTLLAVGVTMYDGSALEIHLATIGAAVLALSSVVATAVRTPWTGTPRGYTVAGHREREEHP